MLEEKHIQYRYYTFFYKNLRTKVIEIFFYDFRFAKKEQTEKNFQSKLNWIKKIKTVLWKVELSINVRRGCSSPLSFSIPTLYYV